MKIETSKIKIIEKLFRTCNQVSSVKIQKEKMCSGETQIERDLKRHINQLHSKIFWFLIGTNCWGLEEKKMEKIMNYICSSVSDTEICKRQFCNPSNKRRPGNLQNFLKLRDLTSQGNKVKQILKSGKPFHKNHLTFGRAQEKEEASIISR